jgi:hypothetical protein
VRHGKAQSRSFHALECLGISMFRSYHVKECVCERERGRQRGGVERERECWRRPILGERSILGIGLILEEKVYFWSTRLRRKKINMHKKKEKKHAGGKAMCRT